MAAIALTLLGSQTLAGTGVDNYVLSATDETNNVQQQECILNCGTTAGVVDVTLPEIVDFNDIDNVKVTVFDVDGNALANNITIRAAGSDTINGAATLVIGANNGVAVLGIANGTEWYATT